MSEHKQRVGCYIDGFNLYYGLRDSKFQRFFWLDLRALMQKIILPKQQVEYVKYFTARVSGGRPADSPAFRKSRESKRKRQTCFLEALRTHDRALQILEGQFLSREVGCRKCGHTWTDAEEKMTDVQIATELLVDGFANRFDTAVIVSADSDLVPPVRALKQSHPHKRVVVAFPPGRNSVELKKEADAQFTISKGQLRKSQMPETIVKADGYELVRPTEWMSTPNAN